MNNLQADQILSEVKAKQLQRKLTNISEKQNESQEQTPKLSSV
jgi:hypothetical protein